MAVFGSFQLLLDILGLSFIYQVMELGGHVLSLSDSSGTIVSKAGLTKSQLAEVCELKNEKRGRLSEYSGAGIEYKAGRCTLYNPYHIQFLHHRVKF